MEKVKVVYAVYVKYGKGKRSFLNLYTLHVVRMFHNDYCLYHVTPQLSLSTIWELQRWLSLTVATESVNGSGIHSVRKTMICVQTVTISKGQYNSQK